MTRCAFSGSVFYGVRMRAVCICGSPRKSGSCSYIIDLFIHAFLGAENTAEKIYISDIDMNYYTGCKMCYDSGICVQQDSVLEVVNKLLQADLVLVAAPSYWADIPAQLKTFINRNTPFGDTNQNRIVKAEKHILGVSVAVRAGSSPGENELILNSIEHYFGHMGITPVKRFSFLNTDCLDDLLANNEKTLKDIEYFAENIR